MKKLLFGLIVMLLIFSNITIIKSQNLKYGYLNSDKLLAEMPEIISANKDIEVFINQINEHIKTKNQEYQKKITDYKKEEKNLSDLIKLDKQKELNQLQEDIKEFQINAQNEINKKKNDLYKPAIDKLKKAIDEVAKENKFKFIIDNNKGQLLYFEEEDNIEPFIRKKLNIK
ncbi:MAG: OmpH family outer membrane protein [Bacteroidales bacterium]|nr:OmpH family outer membrane protein [Bacteroidales bacterium]MBN2756931.1 OmpH family outer membrane protein [Bacteroidales bacterium]